MQQSSHLEMLLDWLCITAIQRTMIINIAHEHLSGLSFISFNRSLLDLFHLLKPCLEFFTKAINLQEWELGLEIAV
jgi:hypothetical protein